VAGNLGADAATTGGSSDEAHPRDEQHEGASGPGSGRLPAGEVREMFDRISSVYDAMNTAMTPAETTIILTTVTVLLHGIGTEIITMPSDTMRDATGTVTGSLTSARASC